MRGTVWELRLYRDRRHLDRQIAAQRPSMKREKKSLIVVDDLQWSTVLGRVEHRVQEISTTKGSRLARNGGAE